MTTSRSIRLFALVCVLVLRGADLHVSQATAAAAPPSMQSATLFAVRFQPGAGWNKSKPPTDQTGFASHSANLQRLRRDGRIVLGGRFADLGLVVITAADATAARESFSADETIAAKVFTIQIDPWSTIFDGCTK
jgi:uncharacterized protein YciI